MNTSAAVLTPASPVATAVAVPASPPLTTAQAAGKPVRHGTHRPGPAPGATDVALTLDGQPVTARQGETILQLADRLGVAIPRLCAADGLRPDGNCRSCVVEIAGERTLAPSCCRSVAPGMAIQATRQRCVVKRLHPTSATPPWPSTWMLA